MNVSMTKDATEQSDHTPHRRTWDVHDVAPALMNHAHLRDYAMEEVACSGIHTNRSKAAQQELPSPPVPSSLLGLSSVASLTVKWPEMLSSNSFLQNLGSVQTSCLDAACSWLIMEENKTHLANQVCQITCARLQPWRSPDSNKHAQLVTELPRSSDPGPRMKTNSASCHSECIPGESMHIS